MHVRQLVERDAVPPDDRYRVVSVPATATLFRRIVDRHVRVARERGIALRVVRRALRQQFPDAELSRQRDCRIQGTEVELWFAYRDGRAQPTAPRHDWWDHSSLARVVFQASGRLTRPNAACRRLLDWPAGNGSPLSLRDLLSSQLFEELVLGSTGRPSDEAWVDSMPMRLSTGRRLDVEFHIQSHLGRYSKLTMRNVADRDRANDWLALRHSAIGNLPTATLRDLFETAPRRTLRSGERLATSLTDDTWVVLITAGIMRLYVALDGYEPTLEYGNGGSLFGTHALLPDDELLLGAQAVTPSVVLQLSTRRVEELAKSNPVFMRALSKDLQLQLREVIRSSAARAAGDLRQRLAREIALLSALNGDVEFVSVTEQQLADGIGTIRESVGRSISDLRRDGSIATTRFGILILDRERLQEAGQVGLGQGSIGIGPGSPV